MGHIFATADSFEVESCDIIKTKDCSGLGAGVAFLIANFGHSETYSQLAGDIAD